MVEEVFGSTCPVHAEIPDLARVKTLDGDRDDYFSDRKRFEPVQSGHALVLASTLPPTSSLSL
jgi:hypothetical protein